MEQGFILYGIIGHLKNSTRAFLMMIKYSQNDHRNNIKSVNHVLADS